MGKSHPPCCTDLCNYNIFSHVKNAAIMKKSKEKTTEFSVYTTQKQTYFTEGCGLHKKELLRKKQQITNCKQ